MPWFCRSEIECQNEPQNGRQGVSRDASAKEGALQGDQGGTYCGYVVVSVPKQARQLDLKLGWRLQVLDHLGQDWTDGGGEAARPAREAVCGVDGGLHLALFQRPEAVDNAVEATARSRGRNTEKAISGLINPFGYGTRATATAQGPPFVDAEQEEARSPMMGVLPLGCIVRKAGQHSGVFSKTRTRKQPGHFKTSRQQCRDAGRRRRAETQGRSSR